MDLFLTLFCIIGLNLAILQSKGDCEPFIERLHSFDIGKVIATAPSFKDLPDKLSIPAAFLGWYLWVILKVHPPKFATK